MLEIHMMFLNSHSVVLPLIAANFLIFNNVPFDIKRSFSLIYYNLLGVLMLRYFYSLNLLCKNITLVFTFLNIFFKIQIVMFSTFDFSAGACTTHIT